MTAPSPAIRSVAVFTGAKDGASPEYGQLARALGATLAHAGVTVVYGGGKVGLMGAVADGALDTGGRVVGIMPEHLVSGEIAHPGLSELEVVGSMHERKQRMADLADAFIALLGGGGTLDEFFEAWTWQQLGVHSKPVGLCGRRFWQPLLDMLDHMVTEGFVRPEDRETLVVADTPDDVLLRLSAWHPPAPKWR